MAEWRSLGNQRNVQVEQRKHCGRTQQDDKCRKPKGDRKSTRLNSSHLVISYAVFCLKKLVRSRAVLAWCCLCILFFNDTADTEIYPLSLHDALPIWVQRRVRPHTWRSGDHLATSGTYK